MPPNKNPTKHYWLYTLRLEQGKYYIGRTSRADPNMRIQEHFNGFYSAQWVKKYKPIEAVEIINIGNIDAEEAERQELHRTLQYMKRYGLQNVRGGKLNYSGQYVKVGVWFWRKEDFQNLIGVLFMTAVILFLGLRAS
jgi:predicted GIY-YIG superfamily endonuclease